MTDQLARRIALRYAKQLNHAEFGQLMQWLSPKAKAAHDKFPRGLRTFDTSTRVMRFNIDPSDYLSYGIEEAKAMMSGGASLLDVVNPMAYRAMKAVLEALRNRQLRFKMVKVPWNEGGSYVEAIFPKKGGEPSKVSPMTWMG